VLARVDALAESPRSSSAANTETPRSSDPVGLEYTIVAGDLLSCCSRVELSGGDLVLADEPAEDLFSADPVLGEAGSPVAGCQLEPVRAAKGAVRPGCVVVQQVFGQYPAQVALIDDQQPAGQFPAQGTYDLSQIAFALGACGGRARILMPSAVNTASKERVNWPARSLIRNLIEAVSWPGPSGSCGQPVSFTRRWGARCCQPGEPGGCRAR
jgi:hypothetical protein